uniref:serine--tRNA ligase n=1 Tax=Chlamydomonas leiostraca TaxID=1034604 RepID=A0A7S0S4I3_9CHLO
MKENLQAVEQNTKNRASNANPRKAVELYDEFVRLKSETDRLRAERNSNSAQMKGKLEKEQRDQLIAKGQQLKEELAVIEEKLAQVESQMQYEGQRVPNLTHPAVPIGGEENAAVLNMIGSQQQFGFTPKDHVAIAEALDMVDFDSASEVSGQKFYYLRNAGALLELALVNWAMTKVVAKHGFTPLMTPDLVKASVLEKCGFQPRGTETQVYSIQDSQLCLTGTAEVPLGGVYMDKVLKESDLPIKMAAFGHCFRTEAGAAGAAGKGLYRVHQFSKVEMFVLCTPAQSEALHEELRQIEVELFSELGLHFKVLDMPSCDLGAPAYRKFDVEAWMPGLNRYGEISSASNCTDYQSRRLNIRYRPSSQGHSDSDDGSSSDGSGAKQGGKKGGKKGGGSSDRGTEFVYTLNATACAVPRMIVAILENFQQEDGSVIVPEPLRPFLGGMEVIKPPARKAGH